MAGTWELLRRRYDDKQGWLIFTEVRSKTGFGAGPEGFCDAMAMSIWPSRGLLLHGFEFKASRSDLIAELKQPAKADPFIRYCDHWWLVLDKAEFADGLEIPATWGILAPKNGSLREVRPAPKLDAEAWKRPFIAAMLRRFYEQHTNVDTKRREAEIQEAARKLAAKLVDERVEKLQQRVEQLIKEHQHERETWQRFQMASGLSISRYNLGQIASAVRLLQHASMAQIGNQLGHIVSIAEGLGESAKEAIEAIKKIGRE